MDERKRKKQVQRIIGFFVLLIGLAGLAGWIWSWGTYASAMDISRHLTGNYLMLWGWPAQYPLLPLACVFPVITISAILWPFRKSKH